MNKNTIYKSPPYLTGYNYTSKKAHGARKVGKILCMRIELGRECNLKCIYCYTDGGEPLPNELKYEEIKSLINQGKELGIESIIIIGAGEPVISPFFKELIEYINSKGIIPVIFTNSISITKDMAEFLYNKNSSVMIKLDSFNANIQDFLTDKRGSYSKIQKGLDNLINAGFTDIQKTNKFRLGISFVTNTHNINEIKDIWKFCRDNNIYPNQEILTPNGRGRNIVNLIPTIAQYKKLKLELLELDQKEYGFDWLPYTPLTGCGCLQFLYSVYITCEGYVRPCAGVEIKQENIREKPLKEILNTNFFQLCLYIDKHLNGKCKNCVYNSECIGCRGIAYTIGINSNKNPLEAICDEDPFCYKDDKIVK